MFAEHHIKYMSHSRKGAHGFTLVEMSVVLVVIGLIVGGIVVGKNLIRNAQLQSIITDYGEYKKAVGRFQMKYGSLPGDMPDAESYWGSDTGCPNTTSNTVKKIATCNGSGNGLIDTAGGAGFGEWHRAWQHLANAGMIPGSYTGVTGPGNQVDVVCGVNAPASKVTGACFGIRFMGTYGDPGWFTSDYGHMLYFGGQTSSYEPITPVLSTAEAYSIDAKIDDGLPGYGNVMTYKNSSSFYDPGCASSDTPSSATYALSTSGIKCSLIFKLGL